MSSDGAAYLPAEDLFSISESIGFIASDFDGSCRDDPRLT
jgi:hypothetical protein